MLEKLTQWLQTFPGWEGQLQVDYLEAAPVGAGLYPRGIAEISRREDVLGNMQVRFKGSFLLRRAAVAGMDNAQWLLALQEWATRQERLGLTPKFGDLPRTERLQIFEGKLESHNQTGCAVYTAQLNAEFTKIFRGE